MGILGRSGGRFAQPAHQATQYRQFFIQLLGCIPIVAMQGDLTGGQNARGYIEGTVLAPTGYVAQGPFLTQPDRAEQSKRPNLQGRVGVRWTQGLSRLAACWMSAS